MRNVESTAPVILLLNDGLITSCYMCSCENVAVTCILYLVGIAKSAQTTSKSSRDRVSSSASELSTAASTATTASLRHSVSKAEETQPSVLGDQPHLTVDMHSKSKSESSKESYTFCLKV